LKGNKKEKIMDKIGDLLNRLVTVNPNAKELVVPNSKYKRAILKVLYEEGWISGITEKQQNIKDLVIYLKRPYTDASNIDWKSLNVKVSRISKPGRRIYHNAKDIQNLVFKVTNIASTVVISTNKGIMTINKAAELNLGGELLFKISSS